MKKLGGLLLALGAALAVGYILFESAVNKPGWRPGFVVFEVRKGESSRSAAKRLLEEGIIQNALAFELEVRISGERVKAGEYRFPGDSSIRRVAAILTTGKTWARPVTIREGLTLAEVAGEYEKAGLASAEDFIFQAQRAAERMKQEGFPGATLEGYLFPDTYSFSKSTPAKAMVEAMLAAFRKKTAQSLPPEAASDPAALHRVVILASIIEKETGAGFERPLISAVFHNRLRIGMPLQSDPTVIYSLPNYDGNIRKKDLSYDSPYNTYRYRGLPPGPIANPGMDSIMAAWAPAPAEYLYFVAKNDGEHYFSKTLAEHNRAVLTFQVNRGRK